MKDPPMLRKLCCLASLTLSMAAGSAIAQVPTLVNGDLEIPDAYLAGFGLARAEGFRIYNYTEYRMIGDGLTPDTVTHSGMYSVRLPGGEGRTAGEFEGVHSEEPLDFNSVSSPRNWPEYTFNPTSGAPITVGCWFNIPADDPMVKSRFGIKLNLLDGNDPGVFFAREWLDIDPEATTGTPPVPNPAPGCTIVDVTTPEGVEKGIHTNGQWVHFVRTLTQAEIVIPTDPTWVPPTNPAHSSLLAERFDIFPEGGTPAPVSHGTVWVDDITFVQAVACAPDYNQDGHLTVQDIFDFLTGWFSGAANADFDHSGGLSVQDIFAFLNSWFAGC
jgi:hypothetical protein